MRALLAVLTLSSGVAQAACLSIEVAPTTVRIGTAPAFAEPAPPRPWQPLTRMEARLRREIDVPCFAFSVTPGVDFGRIGMAIQTARRVWTVPAALRVHGQTVALHFTQILQAPPDLPDHSGCMRPRAAIRADRFKLYREFRGDVLYVQTSRDLGIGGAGFERLADVFKDADQPAPRPVFGGGRAKTVAPKTPKPPPAQPRSPWTPPEPPPDATVPHGANAATAITRWVSAFAEDDANCKSAAIDGATSLPFSQVAQAVLGLAAGGYVPELRPMLVD